MVRSFIATARAHVHNMTTNFGRTCMPWGPKRSLFAGGTGALFIVPGVVMYVHDPDAPHAVRYLAAFALQAVLSVMSDYVMTGRHSVWHGMDRWYASGMTVSLFAPTPIDPTHRCFFNRVNQTSIILSPSPPPSVAGVHDTVRALRAVPNARAPRSPAPVLPVQGQRRYPAERFPVLLELARVVAHPRRRRRFALRGPSQRGRRTVHASGNAARAVASRRGFNS